MLTGNRTRAVLLLAFCLSSSVAFADTFTFQTIPASGAVSGPAGSTVGWGYSITNDSTTYWLVSTFLNADPFSNGTPNLIFDFPIIAPGATVTVPFNALAGIGLYQLEWDPSAPVGSMNSGTFVLSAEWWTGDPFAGGDFVEQALDQSATYLATVTPAGVPEPSTLLLLIAGLGACGLKGLKRPKIARLF